MDLKAGIKVRFIKYDVFKTLSSEEDFGIWDNEYVCIINRNQQGKELDLLLDSRIESIKNAQDWREQILNNSTEIKSLIEINHWKKGNK